MVNRKLQIAVLVSMLAATLAACGGGGSSGSGANTSPPTAPVETPPPPTPEPTPAPSPTPTPEPTPAPPPANTAPTISGTPSNTVATGASYSFTPVAADADGNSLSFTIANKPAWASFNVATGRISGTPTVAHVGTQSGIVISVSDGTATVALPAFSITVSQPAPSGTAALSWSAPTQNTDGSALSDLAGYYVYHGTSPGSLTMAVELRGNSVTNYTFNALANGTHYFAISAFNASGVESALSGVGSKTIL